MHTEHYKSNIDMSIDEIMIPMLYGILTWFHQTIPKLFILASSIVTFLSLELFSTPEFWWKTLTYLVLLDWASGTITALYEERFDRRIFLRKIYTATGYMIVCSASALLANGMPELFYFVQFIVYASLFSVEFYSILNTWRVWALFVAVAKIVTGGKTYINQFKEFSEAIAKEHEKINKNKINHDR